MTAATCSDILVCRHIFGLGGGGGGGGGPLAPHNARAPGCGVCANLVHADCWHYLHAMGTYRAQAAQAWRGRDTEITARINNSSPVSAVNCQRTFAKFHLFQHCK